MSKKTNQQVALEVIAGHWGNGIARRQKLEAAGYSYADIQSIVNAVMSGANLPPEQEPETIIPGNLMKVDFDPSKYDGMEVTIKL